MTRDCHIIDESMPLDQAFAIMQQTGHSMLPVLRDQRLVGVLTTDNIEEWLVVRGALGKHVDDTPTEAGPLIAEPVSA